MTVIGWEIKKTEVLKSEVVHKHNLEGCFVVAVKTSKTEKGIEKEYFPLKNGRMLRKLIFENTKLTTDDIDNMILKKK